MMKGIEIKNLLVQQTAYNFWANDRIAQFVADRPELIGQLTNSSFETIEKTIHHIWDAELIWFGRLQGKALPWPPTAHLFPNASIVDFVNTSKEWARLLENAAAFFLDGSTTYRDSKGVTYETANTGIVMHCMNHSAYHRGQVITQLHQLGVSRSLPNTDLIGYLRIHPGSE